MFRNIGGKEDVENCEERVGKGEEKGDTNKERDGEGTVRKAVPILGGFLLLAGSQKACSALSGSRHELHG